MRTFLNPIVQPFRDFLFVTECFHCGNRLQHGESRVCRSCWDSLTTVSENDYTFNVLKERFVSGGFIDEFTPLYYFEKGKVLQQLAHSLKYEEVTAFGVELGVKLAGKLQGKKIDAIIPVPLNKRKERERGYNQSDYLADGIADVLGIPVRKKLVIREKYTITQTHLNAEQRRENITGAFSVGNEDAVKEKTLLIVDDIITTGSTIQEIAKVLKNAGAEKIIVASAALAKLGEDR